MGHSLPYITVREYSTVMFLKSTNATKSGQPIYMYKGQKTRVLVFKNSCLAFLPRSTPPPPPVCTLTITDKHACLQRLCISEPHLSSFGSNALWTFVYIEERPHTMTCPVLVVQPRPPERASGQNFNTVPHSLAGEDSFAESYVTFEHQCETLLWRVYYEYLILRVAVIHVLFVLSVKLSNPVIIINL